MRKYLKPDRFVILATVVIILLTIFLVCQYVSTQSVILLLVSVFMMFTCIVFLPVVPLYIEKRDNSVVLRQLLFTKIFELSEVEINHISEKDMAMTKRLFGSGGLFGYIGWFRNPKLGKFYMIANSKKDLVLIKTKEGKNYVINFPFEK